MLRRKMHAQLHGVPQMTAPLEVAGEGYTSGHNEGGAHSWAVGSILLLWRGITLLGSGTLPLGRSMLGEGYTTGHRHVPVQRVPHMKTMSGRRCR